MIIDNHFHRIIPNFGYRLRVLKTTQKCRNSPKLQKQPKNGKTEQVQKWKLIRGRPHDVYWPKIYENPPKSKKSRKSWKRAKTQKMLFQQSPQEMFLFLGKLLISMYFFRNNRIQVLKLHTLGAWSCSGGSVHCSAVTLKGSLFRDNSPIHPIPPIPSAYSSECSKLLLTVLNCSKLTRPDHMVLR